MVGLEAVKQLITNAHAQRKNFFLTIFPVANPGQEALSHFSLSCSTTELGHAKVPIPCMSSSRPDGSLILYVWLLHNLLQNLAIVLASYTIALSTRRFSSTINALRTAVERISVSENCKVVQLKSDHLNRWLRP